MQQPTKSCHRLAALVVCTVGCSLLAAPAARAVVTSDQIGSHLTTPGVEAFGVNPDGVVTLGGLLGPDLLGFASGALITDRHVLTVAHAFDEDADGQVDFLIELLPHDAIFQLSAGYVAIEMDLATIQFPPAWPDSNTDVAILTLTEDAPPGVPRYPLYGGRDEVGREIVIIGSGNAGYGPTGQDDSYDWQSTKRAGLNRYDAYRDDLPGTEVLVYDFDSGLDANNALGIIGFVSELGFGADEVGTAPGDSGGPSFIGGAIAGVASYNDRFDEADATAELDYSWGEAAFDMRVSFFRDFILDATGGEARFVPEPETALLLAIILAFGSLFAKRFVGRV